MARILVQEADFNAGAELALLGGENAGGVASFIGIVRGQTKENRRIIALTLEHYPGMTEKILAGIANAAEVKFGLTSVTVIHRAGRLLPGQNIVFVGAASPHRQAALQAVAFLIDYLKTNAPFWKSEAFEGGETEWVTARETDALAATDWPGNN